MSSKGKRALDAFEHEHLYRVSMKDSGRIKAGHRILGSKDLAWWPPDGDRA